MRAEGKRLVVTPARALGTGAYRVDWHTVSTEDGHALEGAFSFGVRADAGAAPALETGPLARGGLVRILARIALYATILMLAAALLLPLLIGRPRGWPVPDLDPGDEGGRVDLEEVRARERRLRGDLAWAAVAAAVVATVADAADAARGVDPGRMGDYLAGNVAGAGRALVVVALVAAALLRDRRPRAAAGAVVLALGAVAASGHAGSADPRVPSILNDWLHLVSGALWLGGIGLLVALWWPVVRFTRPGSRVAIAREVLAPFGRIAIGAFLVAVSTGLVSLVTQLGRVAALWDTAYGRLLAVKIVVVGLIAAASFVHARRLRPRLLEGGAREGDERRHWTLWRSEPWLGLAVVAAVAGLVAFPLPPRQLDQAGQARAAVCDPCPLPRPAADELGVADSAGSSVVAGWIRRTPHARRGNGARARPQGRAGARAGRAARGADFLVRRRLPALPPARRRHRRRGARCRERGRRYATTLPATWDRGGERAGAGAAAPGGADDARAARRARARAAHERARHERDDGVPAARARPPRLAHGARRRERRDRPPPVDPPARDRLARGALRLGAGVQDPLVVRLEPLRPRGAAALRARRDAAELALMDEGTPVWFRLTVDLATHRVVAEHMTARARFIDTRFVDFGKRFRIEAPR